MLGNVKSDSTRQFVGIAFYERLESLVDIQLWIKVVRRSVEHRRRLVGTIADNRHINVGGLIGLNILNQLMGLVSDYAVVQADVSLEAVGQSPEHQFDVVLLQILTEIGTGNLQKQGRTVLRERLEDNWLEPGFVLLLSDVLPYQMEAVVPKRLMTVLHLAFLVN